MSSVYVDLSSRFGAIGDVVTHHESSIFDFTIKFYSICGNKIIFSNISIIYLLYENICMSKIHWIGIWSNHVGDLFIQWMDDWCPSEIMKNKIKEDVWAMCK